MLLVELASAGVKAGGVRCGRCSERARYRMGRWLIQFVSSFVRNARSTSLCACMGQQNLIAGGMRHVPGPA